jgi:hypothetical protein
VRCAPLSLTAGAISCPIGLGSDAAPVGMNLFGVPTYRSLARAGKLELMRRFGDFTWVTHHDELGIPFFQASDVGPDGRRVARNADLLMGIGETVGAGERHERADDVREALPRPAAVVPRERPAHPPVTRWA